VREAADPQAVRPLLKVPFIEGLAVQVFDLYEAFGPEIFLGALEGRGDDGHPETIAAMNTHFAAIRASIAALDASIAA